MSLMPAVITTLGVCGIRIGWIQFVFPHSHTFETIMIGYPASLGVTAVLVLIALIWTRPSKKLSGENISDKIKD